VPFKKPAIPSNLGAVADLYYKIRNQRLQEEKKINEVKEFESELRRHLINSIPKSELTGVAGRVVRATITTKEVYQAENWDNVYEYIRKNKAFDLLQKKINTTAVKERIAAGKKVPGVTSVNVVDVSITKIPAKK
jgi:nitrogenase subunit NifH